ncbi:MAG TPA: DUF1059 domain-containing protein [Mycobacteriales bacterium]|nr:DUF1059 domain-containing protein [Mycobacteriales bacterium]
MRKVADCRETPSVAGCTLTISGEEDEVVRAAVEHAASVHGHADTPALREQVRATLADETPAGRYGTVMIATLTGDYDALLTACRDWAEQRRADGFLVEEVMRADDGRTVVACVWFSDASAYRRLADDPEQDRWWSERFAPHLTDVRWIDGAWAAAKHRSPAPQIPAATPAS